jgi:hypothetical protein
MVQVRDINLISSLALSGATFRTLHFFSKTVVCSLFYYLQPFILLHHSTLESMIQHESSNSLYQSNMRRLCNPHSNRPSSEKEDTLATYKLNFPVRDSSHSLETNSSADKLLEITRKRNTVSTLENPT